MSSVLIELKPTKVFKYFEDICDIPHGSRNTKEISDYCVAFAKEHNLKYIQDGTNNVIIFKDASPGFEDHDSVILQGHLDMVNEKTSDSLHDFQKDGLNLVIDGDYIHCKDTTLGADDGIAVAYVLAILDDVSLVHPPIEAVFTVDEEIGLLGANALDVTPLKGKYLINIDSEEEGIFTVGCAGGVTANITFPIDRISARGITYKLSITGLNGGHSGTEIDKGYANAHKLLGILLYQLKSNDVYYGISQISGGSKDNVIPNICNVQLLLPNDEDNKALALQTIAELNSNFNVEYQIADPNIQIKLEANNNGIEEDINIMSMKCNMILTFFLMHAPNGIQYMNQSIKGLVETSLNMGILNTTNENINIGFSVRSSVKSSKNHLMDQLTYMSEFLGGECEFQGEYPSWAYRKDSNLRTIFTKTYKELYGKHAKVETIHAGLECGIFYEKFEEQGKTLDIISFGPDIQHIHTTKEALSISSVQRSWEFAIEILGKL